jgi:hypothetical protein
MTEKSVKEIIQTAALDSEAISVLEELAAFWAARAANHDEIAAQWDKTRAGHEQKLLDSGIAGGYRAASDDIRAAIEGR